MRISSAEYNNLCWREILPLYGFRLCLAFSFFVASAAGAAAPAEYAGKDGGYLVYSVGTLDDVPFRFSFPYQALTLSNGQDPAAWEGSIAPRLTGAFKLKIKNPDYVGSETGHVYIRKLPPGSYQVGQFDFSTTNIFSGWSYQYSSAAPFALPFTIEPGKATYIGRFMRAYGGGKSLASQLNPLSYFIVADRSESDMALAKNRLPVSISFDVHVTDVSKFGSPMLRSENGAVAK